MDLSILIIFSLKISSFSVFLASLSYYCCWPGLSSLGGWLAGEVFLPFSFCFSLVKAYTAKASSSTKDDCKLLLKVRWLDESESDLRVRLDFSDRGSLGLGVLLLLPKRACFNSSNCWLDWFVPYLKDYKCFRILF